jgi:hypothetical protein
MAAFWAIGATKGDDDPPCLPALGEDDSITKIVDFGAQGAGPKTSWVTVNRENDTSGFVVFTMTFLTPGCRGWGDRRTSRRPPASPCSLRRSSASRRMSSVGAGPRKTEPMWGGFHLAQWSVRPHARWDGVDTINMCRQNGIQLDSMFDTKLGGVP